MQHASLKSVVHFGMVELVGMLQQQRLLPIIPISSRQRGPLLDDLV